MSQFQNGQFDNGQFDNGQFLGPFDSFGPNSLRTTDLVFAVPAGSTTPIVSAALGWEPKAAIIMSIFRSGTGIGTAPGLSFGFASKEGTREVCLTSHQTPDQSVAANALAKCGIYTDASAVQIDGTVVLGKASLTFQDETVTLTPTDAFPANVDIHVALLGGGGVRRNRAGTWNIPTGLTPQSFVDPDFRPTVLLYFSAVSVAAPNTVSGTFNLEVAFAASPLDCVAMAARHVSAGANPGTWARVMGSRFHFAITGAGGDSKIIDLQSFDTAGVTLQPVLNGSASIAGWLALEGPQAACFRTLTQVAPGPWVAATGLPFDPRRVLFATNPLAPATQAASTEPMAIMLGTSDGVAQHSFNYHSHDYSPISAAADHLTDPIGVRSATRAGIKTVRTTQNNGSLVGDFTVSDLSGGEIELTQQDAEPTPYFLAGIALGDALPLPDPPAPSDVITVRERRQGGFRRRRFL